MKHPVVHRTSPKGRGFEFIGTCAACGKSGITFDQLRTDECENIRDLTQEKAIIEAITGGKNETSH